MLSVDLFIYRSAPEVFELRVYVNDKHVETIASGFTYSGIVDFINMNEDDITDAYGEFDVIIDPNCLI